MAKLNNIKAVREMMSGTHKTQTKTHVGYEQKGEIKRKVGEKWTDEEGYEWEQVSDTVKVRHGKFDELRKSLQKARNCPKPEGHFCNMGKKRLDAKYNTIHGMCMDCAIDFEAKLRQEGKWKEYEQTKIKQNVLDWVYDAEQQVQEMWKSVGEKVEYVNENGTIDTFEPTWDVEKLRQSITDEWDRVKNESLTNHGLDDEAYESFKRDKQQAAGA